LAVAKFILQQVARDFAREATPTVQTVANLIFVKRLRSRASKLEFDNSGKTPAMSIDEFSEFCALLQAQRKQFDNPRVLPMRMPLLRR
jgi:hypothetical protein